MVIASVTLAAWSWTAKVCILHLETRFLQGIETVGQYPLHLDSLLTGQDIVGGAK